MQEKHDQEISDLKKQIKMLSDQIKYIPGGPGAIAAAEDFKRRIDG